MCYERAVIDRVYGGLSALGFVAGGALHLATFTALALPGGDWPALVLLAGAFAMLGGMVGRLRAAGAPSRTWGRITVYDWRALLAMVPAPIRALALATVLYVLMNGLLSLAVAAPTTRLLSGQLLLFYLVPLIYFQFVGPHLAARPRSPVSTKEAS